MAIHRSDVSDPKGFKERRRLKELSDSSLKSLHCALGRGANEGQVMEELLEATLAPDVGGVQADIGQRMSQHLADAVSDLVGQSLCAAIASGCWITDDWPGDLPNYRPTGRPY